MLQRLDAKWVLDFHSGGEVGTSNTCHFVVFP